MTPVILWDIDGTLLRTPGIGVKAFSTAVERVAGVAWDPRRLDFGGRTDPEIAALILADAGVGDVSLVPAVLEALLVAYDELAEELRAAVRVMPGVSSALAALADAGAIQTVVTGNLRPVAAAKLRAAGLDGHLLGDIGGYGSDHAERAQVVRISLERIAATHADPGEVWVIGDTPRDLAGARANGARCVLVATGTFPIDELRNLDADAVLADLGDPGQLLDAITRRSA